jgi:FlaA1/EpsC-like NDP-sugar epimerase
MTKIQNLINSEPIAVNGDGLREQISNRSILVTGAGGSIGSELCRQIARYQPRQLILLGHGEHSIFTVASQLNLQDRDLSAVCVIASVQDRARLEKIFLDLQPEIVFHAAAHKHVPLMETNYEEAILNNVLGTENAVNAAIKSQAETFILVSTDKAVNPVSILGATKRVAELITKRAAEVTGRCFVSVRFGNVIDSRGGVVGIFKEQISRGGPVTVTHPEMQRCFMTTQDAVHLILQATKLGHGGEIFVFDLGEPLRIVDIARALIESSVPEASRQVKIVFTGVRPGERLTEEPFRDGDYEATEYPKLLVVRNGSNGRNTGSMQDLTRLEEQIDKLVAAARRSNFADIQARLRDIVPEYRQIAQVATAPGALS